MRVCVMCIPIFFSIKVLIKLRLWINFPNNVIIIEIIQHSSLHWFFSLAAPVLGLNLDRFWITVFQYISFLLKCIHMDDVISLYVFMLFQNNFNYNLYMVQMEGKFIYYSNVMIFDKSIYCFFNKYWSLVFIDFSYLVILIWLVALTTCLIIFNGSGSNILSLWYVFKDIKSNCFCVVIFHFLLWVLLSLFHLNNNPKQNWNLK